MDEINEVDKATLLRWMVHTRGVPQEVADRLADEHPGADLVEAVLRQGLISKVDLDRLTNDVLEGLGMPDRIGSLAVQYELGRGGMGIVLKARDEELERDVAVKLLPSALALQADARARFERECRAVARLDHPSIVRLFKTGEHEGIAYAVMEYIPGMSLDSLLTARKRTGAAPSAPLRTLPETLLAFAEIADALHYAHGQGVIHRDVKPANMAADPKGRLHLLDFGLACLSDNKQITFTGDMMGTPAYMSPEQVLSGRLSVGPATDIYSLGASLYEALTGRTPHEDSNRQKLLEKILWHDPTPPSQVKPVPPEVDAVVLQCLRKEPPSRYATAAQLADDLRRCANGEPVSAKPWGWIRRKVHQLQRLPAQAGYGTLSLAMVGAAALIGLLSMAVFAALPKLPSRTEEVAGHIIVAVFTFIALVIAVRGAGVTSLKKDIVRTTAVALACLGLMPSSHNLLEWAWPSGFLSGGLAAAHFFVCALAAVVWMQTCMSGLRRVNAWALILLAAGHAGLVLFNGDLTSGHDRLALAVRGLALPAAAGLGSLLLFLVMRTSRPHMGRWIAAHAILLAGFAAFLAGGGGVSR